MFSYIILESESFFYVKINKLKLFYFHIFLRSVQSSRTMDIPIVRKLKKIKWRY